MNETTQTPATIVHGARIVSTRAAEHASIALDTDSALAIADGRVLARGDDEQIMALAGPDTELIDMAGRTVLPGFIETHIHLAHYGANLLEVDCRPTATDSVAAIQDALRAEAAEPSATEWILGWGWDESRMAAGAAPTRWDLDAAVSDRPVLLRRTCAHMAVLNSRALELAGITDYTPDPDGGRIVRDQSGAATGLVQESALNLIPLPAKTNEEVARGILLAQEQFLSRGLTTVHDMATQEPDLAALESLRGHGLRMRVRPWMWALDGNGFQGTLETVIERGWTSGTGDELVRIQGMKFMLDGSVGGRTAAVDEPYEDSADTGILIHTADEAAPQVIRAVSHGLRAAIHGIGDRAVDTAVEVLTRTAKQCPEAATMRNRIEHCALPSRDNLEQMAALGIIAASSVGFLHELGDSYLANLGPERMARVYPQADYAEHGIIAPPNSDCPVTDSNPWPIIDASVNRRSLSDQVLDTAQNISLARAVDGYTRQAAMASFEDGLLGSLAPGSCADFIVLDTDPFADGVDLRKVRVERTYVDGDCVFTR